MQTRESVSATGCDSRLSFLAESDFWSLYLSLVLWSIHLSTISNGYLESKLDTESGTDGHAEGADCGGHCSRIVVENHQQVFQQMHLEAGHQFG